MIEAADVSVGFWLEETPTTLWAFSRWHYKNITTFYNLRQGGCGIGFFNVYILSNLLKKKKNSEQICIDVLGPGPT